MKGLLLRAGRSLARRVAFAVKRPRNRHADHRSVAGVKRTLASLAREDGPIIVGPWVSEVGFEILYWIPFLNWVVNEYKLDRDRITIVSRGDVRSWYHGIARNYRDIFSVISPDEFRLMNEERSRLTKLQKHTVRSPIDVTILSRLGIEQTHLSIHPEIMYSLFDGYWSGASGFSEFTDHTIFRRIKTPKHDIKNQLPESYVAVKFYSRASLPVEDNRRFVERLTLQLAEKSPVVVLNTNVRADEHLEFEVPRHPNIVTIERWLQPNVNLLVQSAVIGGASHTYCSYGGFAYLPLTLGVPATGFFSRDKHFLRIHARAAYWLSNRTKTPLSIIDTRSLDILLRE